MGTSAPVIIETDFPITEPYKEPLRLPEPNPDTFAPRIVPVPVREPVPVRRPEHGSCE